MLNKKSGKKKSAKHLASKSLKCKFYHSLLLGFPIIEAWKDNGKSHYECSYCGRVWKGKHREKNLPLYRFLRG